MKRCFAFMLIFSVVSAIPAQAATIRWVDFAVPYESLEYAMNVDVETYEMEKHISWIDILSVAACRTGGKCPLVSVKNAANDLKEDKSPAEILGGMFKNYEYYHEAYAAVLGD